MGKRIQYATVEGDARATRLYLRTAWKRCYHCKATPHMHHVENFMPLHHDGQVFCNYCSTYLGVWDEAFGGMVSRGEELVTTVRRVQEMGVLPKATSKRSVPVVQKMFEVSPIEIEL